MSDSLLRGMSDPLYRAEGIVKEYRSGNQVLRILDGLSVDLRAGEIAAVVGASGVGKSTLLHVLGLLDDPVQGRLLLGGRDLRALRGAPRDEVRNREIGFVFQFFHLVPELSAEENVLLPARIGTGFLEWMRVSRERRERARELLDHVGLSGRLLHRPAQLSGGERQRVAIARAMMNGPRILLCDEPTGNLDPATSRGVWDVLRGFRGTGRSILVVTHNEALAADADQVWRLQEGRLVEAALAR